MKVTVNVCYVGDKATLGEGGRLSLSTKPSDTVLRLKQRVAMVEPVPFPEQELQLEGKVLEEHLRLEQLELDGKPLTFVVKATQAILTKQLLELLQARPVSANELSMMYSHKHGATVKQALSILGLPQSLEELLSNSKAFSVASGLVSAAPSSTQVQVLLKSNLGNVVNAAVELKAGPALQQLVEKALAAELIPFEATKVSEQGSTVQVLVEISKETVIQQLHALLGGGLSITELGDLYCYRYGAPVPRALELLGERGSLKDFLKQNPERFVLQAGCVMKREPNEPFLADFGVLNQRYLDLDAEISSLQETEEVVERVIQSAMEGLEVCGVIRGGSLGHGTACSGNVDSEVLLLLKGVVGDRAVWLPPLLLAVVAAVSKELQGAEALVHGDAVRVSVPGAVVSLSMDVVGGEVALLAAKRARGFAKVPATAKMTMRLLKWWRNQHQWSSDGRPSDGLLEELVGSVKGPRDQAQAVEVALSALQGLNQEARTYFDQQLLSV